MTNLNQKDLYGESFHKTSLPPSRRSFFSSPLKCNWVLGEALTSPKYPHHSDSYWNTIGFLAPLSVDFVHLVVKFF